MQCDDPKLFQEWILQWRGFGVTFEIVPVGPSNETQTVVAPYLDLVPGSGSAMTTIRRPTRLPADCCRRRPGALHAGRDPGDAGAAVAEHDEGGGRGSAAPATRVLRKSLRTIRPPLDCRSAPSPSRW